ncbi:MAG: Holliday junction branch migration DNA helicase RuvB [Candidatus Eisenbacteria bacterium]|nr:Holliday junction branch migration DNA helicase RuvB [Candidatus Eisenbacteria bacterium]
MSRQPDHRGPAWSDPNPLEGEERQELDLRPKSLAEFVGQESVRENLIVQVKAALMRHDPLEHLLLTGPPGLGKTSLALLLGREMGAEVKSTSGPVLDRPYDLAGLLTSLPRGGVLFIDEIHRLNRTVEEYLYQAMEDFRLDIMLDRGPNARSVQVPLERFTLIGATTRAGLLTSPLRSRFGWVGRVDFYRSDEIALILGRSARILGLEVEPAALDEIARRSRGTPRIANRLLRRVRDYAQVRGERVVTLHRAQDALELLNIDAAGLDEMDRRILEVICQRFAGGPVGLSTLAASVSEEAETLEEVHEPYLVQQGYLQRTRLGRVATANAYRALGLAAPNGTQESFL